MIEDTARAQSFQDIRTTGLYLPKWFRTKDFAFCKILVGTKGEIELDYLDLYSRNRVKVESYSEFVGWMTKTKHTFVANTVAELDACINLHPSFRFKLDLHINSRAHDGAYHVYRATHKINFREGNNWHHVLDISDLSRKDSYNLETLEDAEQIREFVLMFLRLCMDYNLVLENNLTWSAVARSFLLTHVPRHAWPNWGNPPEFAVQAAFFEWCKGPHHGARTLGTFVGSDFDSIKSHLRILESLHGHSPFHCKYVCDKHFNPSAAYAIYWIRCNLPKLAFMPWRIRLREESTEYEPEVYGEQQVAVLQPELAAAIKVLGLKEGKNFEVLQSFQVVPMKPDYPYVKACKSMLSLIEEAPKIMHFKTMYHRFVGMMYHTITTSGGIVASSIFDPMLAATVWATERALCWEGLMSSVNPQYSSIDGGTAAQPKVDGGTHTIGPLGTRLGVTAQYKDVVGSIYYRNLIAEDRDSPFISIPRHNRVTFGAAYHEQCGDFSLVGKVVPQIYKMFPGDECRETPKIDHVGQLLEGQLETAPLSPERALEKLAVRRKEDIKKGML